MVPVLPARPEHQGLREAGLLRSYTDSSQPGARPANRQTSSSTALGILRPTTGGMGPTAPPYGDPTGYIRILSWAGERSVESRVRENLTHGSERGRRKHGLHNDVCAPAVYSTCVQQAVIDLPVKVRSR